MPAGAPSGAYAARDDARPASGGRGAWRSSSSETRIVCQTIQVATWLVALKALLTMGAT